MANTFNKTGIVFLILVGTILGYGLTVRYLIPVTWMYSTEMEESRQLIKEIEGFRTDFDRLPTESEVYKLKLVLGLSRGMTCPCYRAQGSKHYTVWFGMSLGSSYVFDSISQVWRETG